MSQRSSISEASMGSAGDEDLQSQIDELYKEINRLERPGHYRQNRESGEVKKYRPKQHERPIVRQLKEQVERQRDRDEAARQYQERLDIAAERERRAEETRRAAMEISVTPQIGQTEQAGNAFVVRSVGISHLDNGHHKANNEVAQQVFRISQIHSIGPGELVRETEKDPELEFVRQALLNNQLNRLPEPYRTFKNSLSTRYGLVFQDDKVVIPFGLQNTFVNLLHRDHAGVQRMKDSAPYVIWKTMDLDLRRKVHECMGCFQSGKNLKTKLPKTEKNKLKYPSQPNEERQLDFHGPIDGVRGKKISWWKWTVFQNGLLRGLHLAQAH